MVTDLKIGFGCSGPWGMKWFSETKAIDLITKAVDLGIREFDTGNFYCNGNAETRLGLALKKVPNAKRNLLRISSKTGTQIGPHGKLYKDFSRETIERDIETSLKKMNLTHLDTVYLHGPTEAEIQQALPVLQTFKEQRVIKKIGLCSTSTSLATAAHLPQIDTIMGSANLFHRTNFNTFKHARQHKKRVIAIAPLAQGLYRKQFLKPKSLPDIWYLTRALVKNRTDLQHARKAQWLHAVSGWSPTDIAMAYIVNSPHVDLAMTTTTKISHLIANVAAAQRSLPADIRDKIERIDHA